MNLQRQSKLPRWIHHAYAHVAAYFWIPCPSCDRNFGGHEWGGSIPHPDKPGINIGVCKPCAPTFTFIKF